ncbi:hypothetical protein ACMGE5_10210 [Macrococcus equi]|uniref:hypothetical protein n=1 Tax=Macrococcus equi TaxID=3395462 RepID=UPI0039BE2C17
MNIIKSLPRDEAITRKLLVAKLGTDETYYRRLNSIINDLIVIFNEPIGSASNLYKNGYFYCRTKEDFILAKKSLLSRIDSVGERVKALNEIEKGDKP